MSSTYSSATPAPAAEELPAAPPTALPLPDCCTGPALEPAACELRHPAKKAASSSASQAVCRSRQARRPPFMQPLQSHSHGGCTPAVVSMVQLLHLVIGKMTDASVSLSQGPSRDRRTQPMPVGHMHRRATRRGKVRRPPAAGTGGGGGGESVRRSAVTSPLVPRHCCWGAIATCTRKNLCAVPSGLRHTLPFSVPAALTASSAAAAFQVALLSPLLPRLVLGLRSSAWCSPMEID